MLKVVDPDQPAEVGVLKYAGADRSMTWASVDEEVCRATKAV